MGLEVVRLNPGAECEPLYRFRYEVYVEEQGLKPRDANQRTRTIHDGLDDCSIQYAAFSEGRVIASLRATLLSDVQAPEALIERFGMTEAIRRFGIRSICTTSRFIIARDHRRSRLSLHLMDAAYCDARERGLRLNFGDCSPHLVGFYEHMGYRTYAPIFVDDDYGVKTPLLMMFGDQEQFRRVRSPLRRTAVRYQDDTEARVWFEAVYPASCETGEPTD